MEGETLGFLAGAILIAADFVWGVAYRRRKPRYVWPAVIAFVHVFAGEILFLGVLDEFLTREQFKQFELLGCLLVLLPPALLYWLVNRSEDISTK